MKNDKCVREDEATNIRVQSRDYRLLHRSPFVVTYELCIRSILQIPYDRV